METRTDPAMLAALVHGLRGPQRLNLRQLEAFSAIVGAGSISAAARLLNVSQPGLSRLLMALEQSLGFALFLRHGKRLAITPEGAEFADEIARSLTGLAALEKAADDLRGMRRAVLRIAALPALCFQLLPRAIAGFMRDHPGLRVQFEALSAQRITEAVAARQVEIGVTQMFGAAPGVAVAATYASDCLCVMPPGHRLAARQVVRPADLEGEALVTLPASSTTGTRLAEVLGGPPEARVETFLSSAACAMVAEGVGVAVVDAFTVEIFGARIESRPFLPAVDFGFQVVHPAPQPLSRPAVAFLAHLAVALAQDGRIRPG
ncbi:LysR family transcriptional regulator [Humitalea sp. 24SJ18S-53]|uniref:LysR family transcriptional regulator n=1 Tax=Humitalea sp. 24SJ18S-53 TaxID=3422307 RepID=UPI003D66A3B3